MAARSSISAACSRSTDRAATSGPTTGSLTHVLAIAVFLGTALAGSAAAQWDRPRAAGREGRAGPERTGRLVPEAGEDRVEPLVARSLPRPRPNVRPQATTSLAPREYRAVTRSFALALGRVESSPRCAALFSKLGRSGSATLRESFYLRADLDSHPQCTSGVAAFTQVGGHRCWLCPHFGSLSTTAGAMILIHEALHGAGLSEGSVTSGTASPQEINRMVRLACELD